MFKIVCSAYDIEKIVGYLLNADGIAFSIKTAYKMNPPCIFIESEFFTEEVYNEFAENIGRAVLHAECENVYVENVDNYKSVTLGDLYHFPNYSELI